MKPEPALVRTDRTVHLNAESTVDVDLTLRVLPRNAKHDDALRFDDALKEFGGAILRMSIQHRAERHNHFLDSLVELGLGRVLRFNFSH